MVLIRPSGDVATLTGDHDHEPQPAAFGHQESFGKALSSVASSATAVIGDTPRQRPKWVGHRSLARTLVRMTAWYTC